MLTARLAPALALALTTALFTPAAQGQSAEKTEARSSHPGAHLPGMHHPGMQASGDPSPGANGAAREGGHHAGAPPDEPGQSAFAALAEIREMLVADPDTDWSRVDLDALREHLVDMDRVVMSADVEVTEVPGGFRARVTGEGRTLAAIRRMVPSHARFMDGREGLATRVADLSKAEGGGAEGVEVTVTTADADAVPRLRALGFFGFLTAGDHHRPHHLMMARGEGHS